MRKLLLPAVLASCAVPAGAGVSHRLIVMEGQAPPDRPTDLIVDVALTPPGFDADGRIIFMGARSDPALPGALPPPSVWTYNGGSLSELLAPGAQPDALPQGSSLPFYWYTHFTPHGGAIVAAQAVIPAPSGAQARRAFFSVDEEIGLVAIERFEDGAGPGVALDEVTPRAASRAGDTVLFTRRGDVRTAPQALWMRSCSGAWSALAVDRAPLAVGELRVDDRYGVPPVALNESADAAMLLWTFNQGVRTRGLWTSRDSSLHEALQLYRPHPDLAAGQKPGIPDTGQPFFHMDPSGALWALTALDAQFDDDSTPEPGACIWTDRSGLMRPVVRAGEAAPGAPGKVFHSFGALDVGPTGVVFSATIGDPEKADRAPGVWRIVDGVIEPVAIDTITLASGETLRLGEVRRVWSAGGARALFVAFPDPHPSLGEGLALLLAGPGGSFVVARAGVPITLEDGGSLNPEFLEAGNAIEYTSLGPANAAVLAVVADGRTAFVAATLPPACAGDLNGDAAVDAADVSALLASWGRAGSSDFDRDGATLAHDLAALLAQWGPCP